MEERAMIELATAFEAGKAGLGLAGEVITIVERLKKQGERDITLRRLLDALRLRALEISRQTESDLARIRAELEDAHVDWDRSIEELLADARWYQWSVKSTLRDARDRFRGMENCLRLLVDDLTSLLLCSGRIAETDGAFAAAQWEKQTLITRVGTQVPLKQLLEALAAMATELTKRASAA
jgi:hypothetical protein